MKNLSNKRKNELINIIGKKEKEIERLKRSQMELFKKIEENNDYIRGMKDLAYLFGRGSSS